MSAEQPLELQHVAPDGGEAGRFTIHLLTALPDAQVSRGVLPSIPPNTDVRLSPTVENQIFYPDPAGSVFVTHCWDALRASFKRLFGPEPQ